MPRKSEPPKGDRQRIQFAYNADVDSPTGVLFQYLIKNERARSREGKHKGIDAMSAFWKPFAYQEQENLSEEELKAIARESIEQLNRQMTLICDTFGLEPPTAATSTVDLKQEIRQAMAEAFQQMIAAGGMPMVTGNLPLAPSPQKPSTQSLSNDLFEESEGVDFDEDALLGTLLDDATIAA
jgi:sulfite reductase alpha subunit-like flavoprotein